MGDKGAQAEGKVWGEEGRQKMKHVIFSMQEDTHPKAGSVVDAHYTQLLHSVTSLQTLVW